jgi:sugar phosphate isomerase/epimerase
MCSWILPTSGSTEPYELVSDRSWTFRSVGYGMGELEWKKFVSALRVAGYDYVLRIEHEDSLASSREGLQKAVQTLKNCVFSEPAGEIWWA